MTWFQKLFGKQVPERPIGRHPAPGQRPLRWVSMSISLGIATALLLAGCKRGPASNRGPVRQVVADCAAAIEAPSGYDLERPKQKLEHLRLSGPDAVTVSVSCFRKSEGGPTTLVGHANWVLGEILAGLPPKAVTIERSSLLEQLDGHPVVALELAGDAYPRSIFVFAERAQAFYWMQYSAPSSSFERHAKEGLAVLQSFHVMDKEIDRGPVRWWHPEVSEDAHSLSDARAGFQTKVPKGRPKTGFDGQPAPTPPSTIFEKVAVPGPVGRLGAYITPDPKDGKRHPAVVWAHGGFGDIDSGFWEARPRSNDQSARAFREAGIVLAVGSWRAENDNPGDYELYYGEVDDLLAVRDHVAKLPYVDPRRIYLAGHSSGGTLVLLAAEKSDGFRAAFSIGGDPLFDSPESYDRYGGVPFDYSDDREIRLRSASSFWRSIRRPAFYFEGSGSSSVGLAQWMGDKAAQAGVPFKAFVAMQANHFSILAPVTELIAKKILADSGPSTNIGFTQDEVDALAVEE